MQKLIQTESVTGDESEIGALMAEECRKDGLDVTIVEPQKKRVSVVARYNSSRGMPKVMMYSHYDTVPSGDLEAWKYPPFYAKIAEGKMWGRGASDNKVATCGLTMSFRALRNLGIEPGGDIVFTHVADEEKGGRYGFRAILDEGYGEGVDYLFYGHGGSKDNIGIAANGSISVTVKVKGKAAHTRSLENGVNAVVKAANLITQLQKHAEEVNTRRYHLPGTESKMMSRFSINRCQGYVANNVVPDRCQILIDRRYTPAEIPQQIESEIIGVINDIKEQDPELDAELFIEPRMDLSISPADSEIVKSIQRSAEKIIGFKPQPVGGSHSSDHGYFVTKHHKPVASYGIGGVGNHMVNEHIELEDIITTTKVYALIMMDLLG